MRAAGHVVHLIADFYPRDAQEIGDAERIAEGCRRGWTLHTLDRRIRYRTDELSALTSGHLLCLTDGNATLGPITQRFLDAMPAIHRAVQRTDIGFWHIHAGGRSPRCGPERAAHPALPFPT